MYKIWPKIKKPKFWTVEVFKVFKKPRFFSKPFSSPGSHYCKKLKTLYFRCILISRFWNVLLDLWWANLTLVGILIVQFLSYLWWNYQKFEACENYVLQYAPLLFYGYNKYYNFRQTKTEVVKFCTGQITIICGQKGNGRSDRKWNVGSSINQELKGLLYSNCEAANINGTIMFSAQHTK